MNTFTRRCFYCSGTGKDSTGQNPCHHCKGAKVVCRVCHKNQQNCLDDGGCVDPSFCPKCDKPEATCTCDNW